MAPNPRNGEQVSCKHDHWHVADSHPIGQCHCDDCGEFIGLAEAFDRLRERAQSLIDNRIPQIPLEDLRRFYDAAWQWPKHPKLQPVYDAIVAALKDY